MVTRRGIKGLRPIKWIDGFSESAWKSLAVKSLRMGWPAGLEEALDRLGRSTVQYLLLAGVFEDVFPAAAELEAAVAEARALEFAGLCRRATHHGRGHTGRFCDLEAEAMQAAEHERPALWAEARRRGLWLPNRALNTFWTWLAIRPTDAGAVRTIDKARWRGMPISMLDGHTYEGRRQWRFATILSGDYDSHRELSRSVRRHGWGPIRRQVHAEHAEPRRHAKQGRLF